MKNITLQIPDKKYAFFMELIKSFDFVVVKNDEVVIPEEHKSIVRNRMDASEKDPSRRLNWDDAKQNIRL
jgi:hypothetical protein